MCSGAVPPTVSLPRLAPVVRVTGCGVGPERRWRRLRAQERCFLRLRPITPWPSMRRNGSPHKGRPVPKGSFQPEREGPRIHRRARSSERALGVHPPAPLATWTSDPGSCSSEPGEALLPLASCSRMAGAGVLGSRPSRSVRALAGEAAAHADRRTNPMDAAHPGDLFHHGVSRRLRTGGGTAKRLRPAGRDVARRVEPMASPDSNRVPHDKSLPEEALSIAVAPRDIYRDASCRTRTSAAKLARRRPYRTSTRTALPGPRRGWRAGGPIRPWERRPDCSGIRPAWVGVSSDSRAGEGDPRRLGSAS